MKSTKHLFLTVLALAAVSAGAWAQTSTSAPSAPKKKHKPVAAAPAQPAITAADVQALKDGLAAQQQQIQQLTQQLQQAQQSWQQAQAAAADAANKASAAQTQAAAAQTQTSQEQQTVGELKGDMAELKTGAALALQESQQTFNKAMESSVTLHFKGINITPGGYAAAEFVRRSRALGADVSTPFNSLTMPGASQSSLSEFFGSARQSKASVFFEGRVKNVDLSSYVSGDFLSAGVTSTATSTNSYTFRLRQAWGQAKFDNGWKFLGGQMWSLVTENAVGIAPADDLGKTNDARPKTIDASYNVGFSFARQYGVRLTKDFGDKVSVAFAMENAQGTLTTHLNQGNFLLGEAGDGKSYNNASNGTYTANPAPDLIAKVAFDPGFGHYEIFGLVDRFTDRVFPCVEYPSTSTLCTAKGATSATGAYNASKEGGGFGANARWNLANKHIVFGLHGFGGSGVGRYGAAQLSDLSINADGTLHLIKGYQGLTTLEYHSKKLDVYAYTGAEYAARTYSFDKLALKGVGQNVGYGAPTFLNYGCYAETAPNGSGGFTPGTLANCTGDTRAVIEGTTGFWYSFYNGPKGRFRFGTQYSYVTRQTWTGANSAGTAGALSPEGLDSMVFTSFRYYLP